MKYSKMLRIWHWLNALAIFGLLATFFLRKTFLSWRDNAQIIIDKTQEYNVTLSPEIAKSIAKAIREPMWEWHIIFGYFLMFLFLFRIFIFLREGVAYIDTSSLHKKLTTIAYTTFYTLSFFMIISGLVLVESEKLGASSFLIHSIKDLHEAVAWFFVFFVPIHILGVVIDEIRKKNSIISKMVSGE